MGVEDTKLAVGPASTNHSIAFLCGTFGSQGFDPFLAQAKKWAKQIQVKAGGAPIIQVADMSEDATVVAQLVTTMSQNSARAAPAQAVLDAQFGGLRGHTLIFLTHGLPSTDANAQGLLIFNFAKGDDPRDRNMLKVHLDNMVLKDEAVVPGDNVATLEVTVDDGKGGQKVDQAATARLKQDITRYAQVLTAVRKSIYTQVYFAACGTAGRLVDFADVFKKLTGKTLFFNDDAISVDEPPFTPHGTVGVFNDDHKTLKSISDGLTYYSRSTIKLDSTSETFLPGSMKRLA